MPEFIRTLETMRYPSAFQLLMNMNPSLKNSNIGIQMPRLVHFFPRNFFSKISLPLAAQKFLKKFTYHRAGEQGVNTAYTNLSHYTLDKAMKIVEAAKRDLERYGHLVEE